MTKIMIDDVDVAECIFYGATNYKSENCYRLGDKYLRSCKGYKDCYYKQLKRKEEECEELRDELEWVHGYKDILNKEKKDLQMQFCTICGESFLTPKGAELYDENEKLKQALQEIKEILEQYLDYDKRVDKEADVDVYLMAIHKWLQKCEVIND